jgi:glucose uptake protein GlcU
MTGIIIMLFAATLMGLMQPLSKKLGNASSGVKCFTIALACFVIALPIFIFEMCSGFSYFSTAGGVIFAISFADGFFLFLGLKYLYRTIEADGVTKSVPLNNIGQFVLAALVSAFLFKQ